ncbi:MULTISPECIES: hypothetical protein [Anaerococcus]|uniref:hypothetical protein n=1 Tax=Anaerococcus TaxID=165779 RepID=UPI001D8D16CF|nr:MULTISPECIES: hypothetical protein [Anaerococcus]MBS5989565.1 hypothetical protein [Anaerococcus hydrogenalis]MDU4026540.1 hypothetical protein [Anaerococcus sp.]
MAFKRQKRQLIKFEFEYEDENKETKYLRYEIEHNNDLANKLIEIGNLDFEKLTNDEAKKALRKAFETILSYGSMDDIQAKVFDGEELLLTDYISIGNYLISEVDKANKELEKMFQTIKSNNTNDEVVDEVVFIEK